RGATVTLTSDTGVLTTATDPNGRFRFPPLAPGPYELFAWQRDAAAWERLDLYRGTADHRVALAPQAVVSIRAEDTGGRSLAAGAPVYLGGLRTVRTDTQGQFEFYGLAPGPYSLLASFDADTPTESNSRAVRLAEGEDQIVDLVLHTPQ